MLQQDRAFSIQQFQDANAILEQRTDEVEKATELKNNLESQVQNLKINDKNLQNEINDKAKELQNVNHQYDVDERECQLAQEQLNVAKQQWIDLQGEVLVIKGALANTQKAIHNQQEVCASLQAQYDLKYDSL